MSANIYWLPSEKGKRLGVNAPSYFLETMGRAFGEGPWELGPSDLLILQGIIATEDGDVGAWKELFEALGVHGVIRIWAEH